MGAIGPLADGSFMDRVRYYTRKSQARLLSESFADPKSKGKNHENMLRRRAEARREFLKGVNVLV